MGTTSWTYSNMSYRVKATMDILSINYIGPLTKNLLQSLYVDKKTNALFKYEIFEYENIFTH